MYKLTGSRRSYDWGSDTAMFDFLESEADGEPFAELWFGAHPTGPSTVHTEGGATTLDQLIAISPGSHLGQRVHSEFGRLPYLLKLLAPARPLSLQVHPDPLLARAGYEDEQSRGIALSDPRRTFKDQHHKPEMVFALSRFEGLVGFRGQAEAARLLEGLGGTVRPACEALRSSPSGQAMRAALELLLRLPAAEVEQAVARCRTMTTSGSDPAAPTAYSTVDELAAFYPGDVGALISLLLNRVVLEPGQLVFLGAGVPHAYLSGFGLELMANSDNVLRLGLTSKHVDSDAMFESVDFGTSGYELQSVPEGAATHVFTPPVPDFALAVCRTGISSGLPVELPGRGPRILICLDGELRVSTSTGAQEHAQEQALKRGEAVYVPASAGTLIVTGGGSAAQAFVP
ncbi:mannose-6-phosphate isomerase type 1 [Arthrobacter sp. AG258]|uniref:mannose-6-phosphate isomerase, class I n=1 Tax=Arthrobacter sp. AG258 TaxID=2183899 RepID=UPI0010F281F4|nr:mannose-6-phosphate isomerase, class I [Arthrobacter sp. AG258]TDT74650.1 mannose-6-phosphate isomerase type 1 [Arthrobacter sp. AG258]